MEKALTKKLKTSGTEYPPALGKSWKTEEINQLLQERAAGKTIDEIAKIHGRTPGGIDSRLRKIVLMYKGELPASEISEKTGFTEDEIKSIVKDAGKKEINLAKKKLNIIELETRLSAIEDKLDQVLQFVSQNSDSKK